MFLFRYFSTTRLPGPVDYWMAEHRDTKIARGKQKNTIELVHNSA